MTIAAAKRPITVEEFMTLPEARDHELVDGNLVEQRNMGARSSYIAGQIMAAIVHFVKEHPVGWPLDSETVYRCFGSSMTGRKADVSFVRRGRFPGERLPDSYVSIAPDLAVEVVSPNDLAYEVNEKVAQYLAAGVSLVWVVMPDTRSIEVRRADGSVTVVRDDQSISGETVLPGFSIPVAEFFPPSENLESFAG